MANTVKMKQSAVAGKVPTTSQLALGELAINTVDGKLFLKKNVSGTESIVDVTGAAAGVSSFNGRTGAVTQTSADVTGALGFTPLSDSNVSKLAPAGAVMHFAKNSPPAGWLKANGAAISRTAYADLFAAIGTTFGAGDGSTTFNLPDLRGEFLRSWADGRGVDTGRAFGSFQWGSNFSVPYYWIDSTAGAMFNEYIDRWAWQGATWDNGLQFIKTVAGSRTSAYGTSFPDRNGSDNLMAHTNAASPLSNTIGVWVTWSGARPRNVALLACIKY